MIIVYVLSLEVYQSQLQRSLQNVRSIEVFHVVELEFAVNSVDHAWTRPPCSSSSLCGAAFAYEFTLNALCWSISFFCESGVYYEFDAIDRHCALCEACCEYYFSLLLVLYWFKYLLNFVFGQLTVKAVNFQRLKLQGFQLSFTILRFIGTCDKHQNTVVHVEFIEVYVLHQLQYLWNASLLKFSIQIFYFCRKLRPRNLKDCAIK